MDGAVGTAQIGNFFANCRVWINRKFWYKALDRSVGFHNVVRPSPIWATAFLRQYLRHDLDIAALLRENVPRTRLTTRKVILTEAAQRHRRDTNRIDHYLFCRPRRHVLRDVLLNASILLKQFRKATTLNRRKLGAQFRRRSLSGD